MNDSRVDEAAANFFADFFGDTSLKEALIDGRSFRYMPQPDITTWELAMCMYLVCRLDAPLRDQQKIYDLLVPEVQRHFVVKQKS